MKSLKDTIKDLGWDVIWDALKKFVTHEITKVATTIILSLGIGWFTHEVQHSGEKKQAADSVTFYRSQAQSYQSNWQSAQNDNYVKDAKFDSMTAYYIKVFIQRGTMMADMKSQLSEQGTHIVALEQTLATFTTTGHDVVESNDSVHDAILDGNITRDKSGKTSFNYLLALELAQIHFQTENLKGIRRDYFHTVLRSTKDTTKVLLEGRDTNTVETLVEIPEDMSMCWIDPALSGGVWWGNALTFGVGYSPFMISSGGNHDKAVIIRYPIVSISSDFKTSTLLAAGIAINAGHWVPLISNISLSPNIGIDLKQKGAVFAIGLTTKL